MKPTYSETTMDAAHNDPASASSGCLSETVAISLPEQSALFSADFPSARTKAFFTSLGMLIALLAALNVLIHFTSRKSQRQQLLARIEHLPPETELLFVGNSLVEAGCDVAAFKTGWPNPNQAPAAQNVALGGTTPVEHYLILNHALAHAERVKCIVYGFFDDQLNAPISASWSELVGNRALSYYFPKDAASFYAPGSSLKVWQMRLVGHIPMLAERSSFWGKVELLRRSIEDIGMPKKPTNRFGRVEDFAALEAKDVPSFIQRCETIVRQSPGFSPAVREMLRLANEHGIKVVLVEMPLPSRHRQLFYSRPVWTEMRNYLRSLTSEEHALYISASDWVPDDSKFEDATHLNKEGAALFSAQLSPRIFPLLDTSGEPTGRVSARR